MWRQSSNIIWIQKPISISNIGNAPPSSTVDACGRHPFTLDKVLGSVAGIPNRNTTPSATAGSFPCIGSLQRWTEIPSVIRYLEEHSAQPRYILGLRVSPAHGMRLTLPMLFCYPHLTNFVYIYIFMTTKLLRSDKNSPISGCFVLLLNRKKHMHIKVAEFLVRIIKLPTSYHLEIYQDRLQFFSAMTAAVTLKTHVLARMGHWQAENLSRQLQE